MNSSKIFHNKKAISEFLLDIWSYIIFAVAIFFFLIAFKLQSINAVERKLVGITEIPTSSSTLINYLKTPLILDGKDINIAELIRLWHLEPNKYKGVLESSTIDILNKLEYEYQNPKTKNTVIRGFNIIISGKKREDKALDYLIQFKSKSFESGFCIANEYGCIILGEQFIPISQNSNLYIVIMESQRAK